MNFVCHGYEPPGLTRGGRLTGNHLMDIRILTPLASPIISVGADSLGIAAAARSQGHSVRIYSGEWSSADGDDVLPLHAYEAETTSSATRVLIYQHAI